MTTIDYRQPRRALNRRRLWRVASIVFATLAIVVLGLWVRSYWWLDKVKIGHPNKVMIVVGCAGGTAEVGIYKFYHPRSAPEWILQSTPRHSSWTNFLRPYDRPLGYSSHPSQFMGFGWSHSDNPIARFTDVWFPLWSVVGVLIVAAVVAYRRRRG